MGLKKTSRRRFGKTLVAGTASAAVASTTAAAQEKQVPAETPPPCVVNPALGEFELPRSAEPAFIFKA